MKSKLLSTIFSSLLLSSTIFSQTITWSNEIIVASGNTYGDTRPRITVTSNNVPVVMWGGGTSTQPLYAARWNGSGFAMPVQITPNGYDPAIMTWSGPDIAANGNTVFAVFKTEPEMSNNIYIVKSTDGGVTWSLPTQVDVGTGPYDRFPSVAVTASGNPAVMMMTFDNTFNTAGYAVTNSTNGGMTFPTPVNVSMLGGSVVCDCCPGYMTIDGSNQAACWRRNNSNTRDMWAGVSTNSGMTFPTGFDVDNTNWMLSSCPSTGPSPHLSSDTLSTVFMSGASGDERVYLNTTNITTSMSGINSMLAPNYPSATIQNYPFFAGSNDTMGVVWQQSSSGNIDVYFSMSMNGAAGLINNEIIATATTSGNQKNPHIAYSANTFHICWVDDNTGNVMYRSGTLSNPNSITENKNGISLQAFPNPSNGDVTINLSPLQHHNGNLKMFDINGKVISNQNVSGKGNVLIEKQIPGIYFVEVSDELTGNTFSTRVIFQ